jgi:hypothetical protein
LLEEHQRVAERTGDLVESLVQDLAKMKDQSERLAVMASRLDALERHVSESDKHCDICQKDIITQMKELERKREENKDKIIKVASDATAALQLHTKEATDAFTTIKVEMAKIAAKYAVGSGIAATTLWFLIQWVVKHGPATP